MSKQVAFSSTRKLIVAGTAGLLLLLFGFVNWAGGKAASFVKEKAAAQDFLEGKLAIGDVGASLSGDVWVSDIVWNDPDGKLVAKIPRLNVSVRLRDIISGGIGVQSIQSVVLESPELHLAYDEKNGLNLLRLIKAEKKEPKQGERDEKTSEFRGTVEVGKGLLQIVSGDKRLRCENLDSKLSYEQYPAVHGTMQAKQNKADFVGKIDLAYALSGNKISLELEGRTIAVRDFFEMMPVKSNVSLSDGIISTLKAVIIAEDKKPLKIETQGTFYDVKGAAAGISLEAFKGGFNGNQENINFADITGNLNGQPLSIKGRVGIGGVVPGLELIVASSAFKIDALSPGLGLDAPLAFDSVITGTPDAPIAKGNFSVASLKTDQMELTNSKGDFRYEQGLIHIANASASMYGGAVSATGLVRMENKSFSFDLQGSGINSTVMTETAIHGPLSFTAHAEGVGDPGSAAATGTFQIGKGDFNGLPFNSMMGDFVKHGEVMNFSNISVNTFAGAVHTDASIGTNGKVKFGTIDTNSIGKEGAKEVLKEQVKQSTGKITDAIKKIF